MRDRVNVSVLFFIIIGAMEGLILSLIPAFLLDYVSTNFTSNCPLSYLDWLSCVAPLFVVFGALFNTASAIFLVDEDTVKPKRRYKRKNTKKTSDKKKK